MLENAKKGLRTLLLGEKIISQQEYDDWSAKLKQAESTIGPNKKRKIEKVNVLIEKDFNVIGSTAVQDNLQDNVPETLARFKRAGIGCWILTGDKEETAINIGFSSGMISNDT